VAHPTEAEAVPGMVVIVDAQALRRAALCSLLRDWAAAQGVTLHDVAPDGVASVVDGVAPRLVILGLGATTVREAPGAAWLARLRATWPSTALAVISDLDASEEVVAALRAGAGGFLPTSTEPDVALHALAFIMRGGSYFPPGAMLGRGPGNAGRGGPGGGPSGREGGQTHRASGLGARQQAILALLQDGRSNKQIGRLLGLPESTVKVHVRRILRRLGAANRTEAALAAQRQSGAVVLALPRRLLKGAA
jgi:DNA-binding NarL/FixJ family response regulator